MSLTSHDSATPWPSINVSSPREPRRSNTNTSITPCSSNCGHTSTSMSGSSLPGRTHSTHYAEKTNGGASTPHPRTRRNSIPAAQECTPPASLCRGFRHTRATIGDVGKPRAIRQNTLVGAVPGVAAWVDEFVPTDHVVGQSSGALDPPARRLTGSSHVRVSEVSEWAGAQVAAWAACPSCRQ